MKNIIINGTFLRQKFLDRTQNQTWFKCIIVNLYTNLFKSTGHNSAENCSIVLKIKTNLDIIMINLYTEFQFDMCTLFEENKRKVLVD